MLRFSYLPSLGLQLQIACPDQGTTQSLSTPSEALQEIGNRKRTMVSTSYSGA